LAIPPRILKTAYNRPGAKVSEGVRESFWLQGMICGMPAAYFCIKAFSETDLTEDLKKIELSSKIVRNAKLVIYEGAPHGMRTTEKDPVNADLLAFLAA
jgi:non-heme chloroperoxidase